MKDIKLDFINHKMLNEYVDKKDRVLQQIIVAVRSWLGDFYLDQDFGVDYSNSWGNILLMETYVKDTIQKIPGVDSITSFKIQKTKQEQGLKLIDVFRIDCTLVYDKEEITVSDIINGI